MKRKEFVAWLKAHPKRYSYSVITGYPAECAWVEKNCHVDLDRAYDEDGLEAVLERLAVKSEANPLAELIDGDSYSNLATYRRAVRSYRKFRDGGAAVRVVGNGPPDTRTGNSSGGAGVGLKEQNAAAVAIELATELATPVSVEIAGIGAGLADLIRNCTVSELLALHAATLDELRQREVVRSANGPGGDYAELLFTRAFGWDRVENSTAGYDAVDWSKRRYQIKSRRLTDVKTSRQLSALRRLPDQDFDYLAAVLFEKDYKISKAVMIPHGTVLNRAKFREHTNSWTFFLDDNVWALPDVQDVTADLRRVAAVLDKAV
jgi:hypothetical protein